MIPQAKAFIMRSYFSELLPGNLCHLRHYFRYAQKEVASHLGVSQQVYSKWERDECLPVEERLAEIARFYGHGIMPQDLLHKTPDELTQQILDWKNSAPPPQVSG